MDPFASTIVWPVFESLLMVNLIGRIVVTGALVSQFHMKQIEISEAKMKLSV